MEVLNALEAFLRVWLMHVATGFGASVTHVLTLAGSGSTPTPPSFEDVLKGWTGYLADGVEGCAGLVIAFAAIQATIPAIFALRTVLKRLFTWEQSRLRQVISQPVFEATAQATGSPSGK